MPNFETVVYRNGWPEAGAAAFEGADAVVVYCDGGGGHVLNPHIDEFAPLMKKGIGLACLHYAVETPKGETGDAFLDWLGGYFETHWSVNPHWDAEFKSFPNHPVTRGVQPFTINDEWYFHMRFRPQMKGVTPVLSAVAPPATMSRPDGPHSGNPAVRAAVAKGLPQHVAWVVEREDGGRGFGFTGGHVHWNWGDPNFRKVVLNALVWIAKSEVPANGVSGDDPSRTQLEENQDFPKPDQANRSNQSRRTVRAKSDQNAGAKFRSDVVTISTPGHSVPVKADITGAKKLFLVVDEADGGINCDWADWMEPKLLGPNGDKKLTDLKWKSASSNWGQVRVNQNAGGQSMLVNGKSVAFGIGTHANSVIEYDLPEGYTQFVAKAGLDNGGTDQNGGGASSVRFLVFTDKLPTQVVRQSRGDAGASRDPAEAVANLDVHPELKATLFAAEPQLLSPSNTDIDHRGRVWVCEIVNYRGHNGKRPDGDRILILEDKDGDGKVDSEKVFYQGRDIDSPHGVCVLGNRIIVSAGENVFLFTDNDGDDKPDDKQLLFTGISGTQHDHGIHAFTFGPDGKLYFNFGNSGKQIKDANGNLMVDKAGNQVKDDRQPYQEGMVFRCNLDGSEFETLGWNFRNNWMVTVDSFGTIWQSDNDDDGNQGVRINYVMEYGNYGYRDEFTGAGWQESRTGMHPDKPYRHWHQNDPGVVPNLLPTGGGSPTGITIYEGDLLPAVFQNQMIHCDAGPSITRAYPVQNDGAGYSATTVNILEGARDRWFRPSDVKVAPDGSLIVADWYDPGVGGHGMGDLDRGRLFRVMPKGHDGKYRIPKFDFSTAAGAVEALKNPNYAVRFMAWTALHDMGEAAEPALTTLWQHQNPRYQARALWLLGKIPGKGQKYVDLATSADNSDIRIVGLRLARQLPDVDTLSVVKKLVNDVSPQVRRECLVALREIKGPTAVDLLAELTAQYDGQDRWYLEAIGIAADGRWDELGEVIHTKADRISEPAKRNLIWRSRATVTPDLLAELILDSETSSEDVIRYFRSYDFQRSDRTQSALAKIAFGELAGSPERIALVRKEALDRIESIDLQNPTQLAALQNALDAAGNSTEFVDLVRRFRVESRYADLISLAANHSSDQVGTEAIRAILALNQTDLLQSAINDAPADIKLSLVQALGNSSDNKATRLVAELMQDDQQGSEVRRQAVRALGQLRSGAEQLLALAKQQQVPDVLSEAVAAALVTSRFRDIQNQAVELYPAAASKDAVPLPAIQDLVRHRGDAVAGRTVFAGVGTCVKCHQVGDEGKSVGPSLAKIGEKLTKQAMFESILYPSAAIAHSYETYQVVLSDGNVATGLLVSETDDQVEIKNAEGIVQRFAKNDVEEMSKQPISVMPANLHSLMTKDDLVNVVEYLTTLK